MTAPSVSQPVLYSELQASLGYRVTETVSQHCPHHIWLNFPWNFFLSFPRSLDCKSSEPTDFPLNKVAVSLETPAFPSTLAVILLESGPIYRVLPCVSVLDYFLRAQGDDGGKKKPTETHELPQDFTWGLKTQSAHLQKLELEGKEREGGRREVGGREGGREDRTLGMENFGGFLFHFAFFCISGRSCVIVPCLWD